MKTHATQTGMTGLAGLRHTFVVLEGLDGTGKSTVARELSGFLEAKLYHTPPEPFRQLRDAIDFANVGREPHFWFYVAALVKASEELEKLLHESPIVGDRYIASTAAYHAPYINGQLRVLKELPLIKPDATVLLVADESTRNNRLLSRDGTKVDAWFKTGIERQTALAALRTYADFEIDTTSKTPRQVATAIIRQLKAREVLR